MSITVTISLVQDLAGNKILSEVVDNLRQKILFYRYRQICQPDRLKASMQAYLQEISLIALSIAVVIGIVRNVNVGPLSMAIALVIATTLVASKSGI